MEAKSFLDRALGRMKNHAPHFLLLSQAEVTDRRSRQGRWAFHLESIDGENVVDAADDEPFEGERLHLMAVVRGLEALDQPSQVTLLTDSKQITRGFRYGLRNWRANGWKWERFGKLTPVKNHDLWQRVDHALQFHRVHCRTWRVDGVQAIAENGRPPVASRISKYFRGLFNPVRRLLTVASLGASNLNRRAA